MKSPTTNWRASYPERIVCLTEETTEALYLLGEQERIVGISGFTVRPPEARKTKPKVSAFTSAKLERIVELKPDLVIGFSDIQANIAKDLVAAGLNTLMFNHRSVQEILSMILTLSGIVGCAEKGQSLVDEYVIRLQSIQAAGRALPCRPRVYFEEWDEPMISAIRWVSELIGIAGGEDVFAHLGNESLAKNRILANGQPVIDANPDVIIGSWCGKKFRPEKVAARAGWEVITAVRNKNLHEIKSPLILQPGPAALSDGLDELHRIISNTAKSC